MKRHPALTTGFVLALLAAGPAWRTEAAEALFPDPQEESQTGGPNVVSGDFDGDGKPDAVMVPDLGSFGSGVFFKGNGHGDFDRIPLGFPTPDIPTGRTQAVDLDGDGDLDLVFALGGAFPSPFPTGEIGVALGAGNGGFFQPTFYEAFAGRFRGPIVGDFNGDRRPDVASIDGFNAGVSVFLGRGDGSLRPTAGLTAPGTVSAIAAGDLNQDGRDDLLVAVGTSVFIHLGRTDGTFVNGGSLATAAQALHVADLDDDGVADVVASQGTGPDGLLVFYGHSLIGPPQPVEVTFPIAEIAAGDLNGDGRLEIVGGTAIDAEFPRENLQVFLAHPDGSYEPGQAVRAGGPGRTINLVDVDLDGRLDLLSASSLSGRLAILFGKGDGTFQSQDQVVDGASPIVAVATDLNGDGRPDLAAINSVSRDLSILLAQPAGGFTGMPRVPLVDVPTGLAAAELNGDGIPDLAVNLGVPGSPPRSRVLFFAGKGDGTFDPPALVSELFAPAGPAGGAILATDLDEDGNADLVSGNNAALFRHRGHGDGTFDAAAFIQGLPTPVASIATADFNGDGHADLGTCGYPAIRILLGDGLGGMTPAPSPAIRCLALATGDFDADGHVDLGIAETPILNLRFLGRGMAVFSGVGDGTFQLTWFAGTVTDAAAAAVADFNADGLDDLVVADTGDSGLGIILSRGDRTFDPTLFFATDRSPRGLAAADLNGDGRKDLAVAHNWSTGGLSILYNTGPQPDADGDGLLNRSDTCTDTDGDGLGDRGFPANTCPEDSCPGVFNPAQEDADADGFGDACDPCPHDGLNDFDQDGVCGDVDLCPANFDPDQEDNDGDGVPNACDNCRATANPDQADGDGDGSGDACQPSVVISSILPKSFDVLAASVTLSDPQADRLRTRVEIHDQGAQIFVPDFLDGPFTCDRGHALGGPGQGFLYAEVALGEVTAAVIADLDSILAGEGIVCDDGQQDFKFAPVACADAKGTTFFDTSVFLNPPVAGITICIRPFQANSGGIDLRILSADTNGLQAILTATDPVLLAEFENGLPPSVGIAHLRFDHQYLLTITATDDTTLPAAASLSFRHTAEQTLVFSSPPHAVASAPDVVECVADGAATVTLDGSASTGGVVAYEWFENFGTPAEQSLGAGAFLDVTLALGTHALTLQVTNESGESDTADFTVTVRDTTPPTLTVSTNPSSLWPPNHELTPVQVTWVAADSCQGPVTVQLVSAGSSEPDDAPGNDDGATAGDMQGLAHGTPDSEVMLRAERDGDGTGRVYTLTYRATDPSGNSTTALATVTVPHDQGHGPEPLLMRLERGSGPDAARLYWPAISGATGYDVISGDLGAWQVRGSTLDIGAVRVLARGAPETSLIEPPSTPELGRGYFYLIRPRVATGPSGYGTESVPWPRVPNSCEAGCP